MIWARPVGGEAALPVGGEAAPPAGGADAFVLDTTGITGASVMPEPTGAVGLDMPAGAALSPPAPAPAAAGARNSATATALACSRAVTCWMNSRGLYAIWGAACRPTKTCWAAAAVSGTREDVSLPVRLQ